MPSGRSFVLWDFGKSPNEIVFYETHIIFRKHLGEMLFAQNTSKNIEIFFEV